MASQAKSRWADTDEDVAIEAQRKKEREAKKIAKLEKQRKAEKEAEQYQAQVISATVLTATKDGSERPSKRRRLSTEPTFENQSSSGGLLRFSAPEWGPCRHVDNFERLNHIEEGSYGFVSRAREIATGEVVALKKLKMDYSNDGFPVTGLREIQTLMASRHSGIVNLREIVMGDKLDEYVASDGTCVTLKQADRQD